MEREGWSLRHPGHRRRVRGEARRLLHECRGAPPHRGGGASARRGLSGELFLAEPRRDRDRVTPKAGSEGANPKRAKSAKGPRCPICGKPAVQDLGRWLGGRYVVPGERVAPQGDEEAED